MDFSEIKRLYRIIRIQFEYGLDELLPNHHFLKIPSWARKSLFWLKNLHPTKEPGERFRLALQELGPVWVKFGQMMSTRRDLFPPHITDQLAILQDRVAPFSGTLAKAQIESAIGGPIERWFTDFDIQPLASASIAQVHTARLKKSGKSVVIKVIRPDIRPVICADIRLMYSVSHLLERISPDMCRLKPVEVVREYEKTLLEELDLRCEAANAAQLRRNFTGSPELYIPEVLSDLSSCNIMVSERIHGIHVSDMEGLCRHGVNLQLLAERGVNVFFTQVFRDSFFHADMHPGNVFVSLDHPENPQWIGLDCGIVGVLNKEDKRYLAENFIAFFNRDYQRVAKLHVDSGWVPYGTNAEEFERAIRAVCEPIFAKPLCEISFGNLLLDLFKTARRFQMEVQPQLVLLQKTLLYVEGLGRQLYPQLDLWTTAKPFLEKWIADQTGLKTIAKLIQAKAPIWSEKIPELPELAYDSLSQLLSVSNKADRIYQEYLRVGQSHSTGRFFFGVGSTLIVCSAILFVVQDHRLSWVPGSLGLLSWGISWRYHRP